ncbi:MAG: hypothetical protein ACYC2Y_10885, partial [Armatimonadota bacterium]
LRTIHVIIIGTLICAVIVVGFYFLFIKKTYTTIGQRQASLDQASQVWQNKASAEADLADARANYALTKSKYDRYLAEKMPPVSFSDRAEGMIALWKEQAEVLGPMVEKWPSHTGVHLTSTISVPAAPVNPNSIDTEMITIPIGNISVTGDFRTVLDHVRSWNKFGRLVQVSPVNLSGPSPGMTAQYSLTVYIFPRGEAGPTVEMAGGGGSTGAVGPGGPPGMGGPMPGGPGGGAPPMPPAAGGNR